MCFAFKVSNAYIEYNHSNIENWINTKKINKGLQVKRLSKPESSTDPIDNGVSSSYKQIKAMISKILNYTLEIHWETKTEAAIPPPKKRAVV